MFNIAIIDTNKSSIAQIFSDFSLNHEFWRCYLFDSSRLLFISRPVSLGRPGSLQPSLGQKPWSTLRPSAFTEGRSAQPGPLMPTGSPPTARPSPLPVKAPPPLPPLLSPLSPIDRGWDQQWEDRRYVSTVWITRWLLPWFPAAITSFV